MGTIFLLTYHQHTAAFTMVAGYVPKGRIHMIEERPRLVRCNTGMNRVSSVSLPSSSHVRAYMRNFWLLDATIIWSAKLEIGSMNLAIKQPTRKFMATM